MLQAVGKTRGNIYEIPYAIYNQTVRARVHAVSDEVKAGSDLLLQARKALFS